MFLGMINNEKDRFMDASDFVGTYKGKGHEQIDKDGRVTHLRDPQSERPARIVYTKEGLVIVVSTPPDRKPLAAKHINAAGDAELTDAARGVVAYAGHYEVKGDKVYHHIDVSFFPNWVGSANVRNFKFDGKLLILTTQPDEEGTVERIYWERMEKA